MDQRPKDLPVDPATIVRRVRRVPWSRVPCPSAAPRRAGFALLIVITMLAFIVLLLIGLAVYTRVETAVAGNTQRQGQARENALLGLNVALSQLQRHAGPDTRITATAHNFGGAAGTRQYTGVWSSDPAASESAVTPLSWLVSGNELSIPDPSPDAKAGSTVPAPLAIKPNAPGPVARLQTLVGANSTGDRTRSANWVDAPLVDLTAFGVPGTPPAAASVIGRYAWWVGDQGVKAPVAVPDSTNAITFAPYNSAELRSRIAQQTALGSGAANAADGSPILEPRDVNNATLVANQKVSTHSQFAFLRSPANAQLGLLRAQQNFHTWSPNNLAVIANTKAGGLRQDLSLSPGLLGNAFAAWVNYPAYMENYVAPVVDAPPAGEGGTPAVSTTPTTTGPAISPAYSADPLRRRYKMTPHQLDGNGSHQVGPVLTYFLITFNVRTAEGATSGTPPLEVRAKWMASLWNPYTSALVPEPLAMEVTGLPRQVTVVSESATTPGPVGRFSLSSEEMYGTTLLINMPWDNTTIPEGTPAEDRQSWLPGRVYTWRSIEDSSKSSTLPDGGFPARFYTRSFTADGETNQGVIRNVPNSPSVPASDDCHLEVVGSEQIFITLYVVRDGARVRLGRFQSPSFVSEFTTATHPISAGSYQFSYVFRLAESLDTPAAPATWLTTDGRDVRRRTLPAEAFVVEANGNSPEQYENYVTISKPDRLLDRASDAWSYNEDVPLFELPRSPLLSLGVLQHFRLVGQRPYMIGNPWGATYLLNNIPAAALFDQFYFSGLVDGVVPATTATGDLILPNPLLKPLRKPDATKVTIDDIRLMASPPSTTNADGTVTPGAPGTAYSSKFFLQGGAFNLNSANAAAWVAVLRGVRFPAPQAFSYLNVSNATGTAADADVATVSSTDAQFFRFSQTAQETYKAEPGMADSSATAGAVSPANTHLFRRGMRTLSGAQVSALAAKIVQLIGTKQAAEGPFRSMEEFLSPSALFAGVDVDGNALAPRSLLEAAIADAGINTDIAEFSSQWLTQADVMTALAPILFPRSDTFVIRSYGEAVNPATGSREGSAWCEATVQRVPEYFDRTDEPDTMASAFDAPSNPNNATSAPTQGHQLNKIFGRRFKVISFRWLTRSDI